MKNYATLLLLIISSSAFGAESFLPNNFSSKFTQIFKSKVTGKKRQSPGSLDYSYPGKIRFAVDDPSGKSLFVSNRIKSWYYTPPFIEGEKGEVTLRKAKKLALTKFFDALKNGLKSNKLYKVVPNKDLVQIEFSKKTSKETKLKAAVLTFKSKEKTFANLKGIQLTRNNGNIVTIELNSIQTGINFSPKHFNFRIPKNTKVIDET